MTEPVINGIFPTPVYISKLNRNLTTKELSFISFNKSNDGCHIFVNKLEEVNKLIPAKI